jgi:hypothetical protein
MTKKENNLALFSGQEIRRFWDEKQEKWYFSVVDVVTVLAQTERLRKYWDDLKRKIKEEGGQLSEKIGQLKFLAKDGKYYLSDAADTKTVFRIIRLFLEENCYLERKKGRY